MQWLWVAETAQENEGRGTVTHTEKKNAWVCNGRQEAEKREEEYAQTEVLVLLKDEPKLH